MAKLVLAAAALVGVMSSSAVLSAQSSGDGTVRISSVRGFSLGASLTSANLNTTIGAATRGESGGGFQVEGGYGGQAFTIGLEYASSNIDETAMDLDEYTYSQIGLLGRVFLRGESKRARPYFEGALLRRAISMDFSNVGGGNIEGSSLNVGFGGGLQIFARENLSFDGSGQYALGSFDDWTEDGDSIALANRSVTNLSWRLGVRFYIH